MLIRITEFAVIILWSDAELLHLHVLSTPTWTHWPFVGTANDVPGSIVGSGDFNSRRLTLECPNNVGEPKQYMQLGTFAHRSIASNTLQSVTFTWFIRIETESKGEKRVSSFPGNSVPKPKRTNTEKKWEQEEEQEKEEKEEKKEKKEKKLTWIGMMTGNNFAFGPPYVY